MAQDLGARARALHEEAFIADTHCDTILAVARGQRTLGERSDQGHIDLPRLREAGVDVQFFACFIEGEFKPDRGQYRALQLIDLFYRQMEAYSDQVAVAHNLAEMDAIRASGRIAAVLAIEGGEAVGPDISGLRILYRLGVRSLGLVWNQRNLLADGVGERRTHGGLTSFGVEVVEEANRLGMLVDVSHLSDEGFWDVIAVSTHPIIASHSNARAVCDHPRNLTDDQIRALAKNGGVMGLNFAPAFVAANRPATVADLAVHAEHIANLAGSADHIGLGSDYDGIGAAPQGLEDVTQLWRLTEALLRRGFSEDDVRKILGGNHRRLLAAVIG